MKKMNLKTMAVAMSALFVFAGSVSAQDSFLTLGIKGGANLSNYSGDIDDNKYVFKYQFGITADMALTDNFYLITGLDFQTKGAKSKPDVGQEVKFNPMYLQIPVHAAYKFDIATDTRFVVEAGPYFAYGIGGKMKGEEKHNIFKDDRFKRFDLGLGAGIGVEYKMFALKGGYDFGLLDISDMSGIKARNHNAYLTLGYRF